MCLSLASPGLTSVAGFHPLNGQRHEFRRGAEREDEHGAWSSPWR